MIDRLKAIPEEDFHVFLVLTLTLSTGAVDAVSYFSLDHTFTANMSGNMALLGIGIVNGIGGVAGNVFAFAGFVTGSIAIGRFLHARRRPFIHLAVEALLAQLLIFIVLTVTVGAIDVSVHAGPRYAVCFVLAAAMGMQTGVARHLSVKDVNTTVATMTLHDLAAASRLAGGDSTRWRRRAGVVVALLGGAAIGVGLDRLVPWGGLAFSSLTVALVVLATVTVGDPARRDESLME